MGSYRLAGGASYPYSRGAPGGVSFRVLSCGGSDSRGSGGHGGGYSSSVIRYYARAVRLVVSVWERRFGWYDAARGSVYVLRACGYSGWSGSCAGY